MGQRSEEIWVQLHNVIKFNWFIRLVFVQGQSNEKAQRRREPSLVLVLFRAYGLDIITGGLYKLCYDMLIFVNPLLLR